MGEDIPLELLPNPSESLSKLFAAGARDAPLEIGLELEMAVVRASDLLPARYEGPAGIGALLAKIQAAGSFTQPTLEDGHLIGLTNAQGENLTLEPGGQLELSTAPAATLKELSDGVTLEVQSLARLAEQEGLHLVGGGMSPASAEEASWMPKHRYTLMRARFASLGEAGRLATTMMQRTLSVQVSLDYRDAHQAEEMLRLALWASPLTTAIFAASPFDGAAEAGLQSLRAAAWLQTDPSRTGIPQGCLREGAALNAFAEYALGVPLLFRVREGQYEAAPPQTTFGGLLEAGSWPDGSPLNHRDLWNHLGSVFTDARLKQGLLELRATDGLQPAEMMSIPALWVGLLYDPQARSEALQLLSGLDPIAHAALCHVVPRVGLATHYGDAPLLSVARSLVGIAQRGLERRQQRGEEQEGAAAILQPLVERLERGKTPADELLAAWRGPWQEERAALVQALRFQPA